MHNDLPALNELVGYLRAIASIKNAQYNLVMPITKLL